MILERASLQPLPPHAILRDPNWYIWGGGKVRTGDGICHLFVARWRKEHGTDLAYSVHVPVRS